MDFEFASWQMVYLFVSPQKVYRNFQYRKRKYNNKICVQIAKKLGFIRKSKVWHANCFCRNQSPIRKRRSCLFSPTRCFLAGVIGWIWTCLETDILWICTVICIHCDCGCSDGGIGYCFVSLVILIAFFKMLSLLVWNGH